MIELDTTLDAAVASLNRARPTIANGPSPILIDTAYTYDVALSFAGDDRTYVSKVADYLRQSGIAVFYDEYEDLWGVRLVEHLNDVYQERSRFVVLFISEHYVRRAYPTHERRSALAGEIIRNHTHVLPARFDDTAVPGLPPDTGFVDLRRIATRELADMIRRKVTSPP